MSEPKYDVRRTLFVLAVPDLARPAAFYRDVLGSAGAEIVKAPATEPWGMREFGLRTIDGHRIMVGQDLET